MGGYVGVAVVLAVALGASAASKLRRSPSMMQMLAGLGVSPAAIPGLAMLEILGAAGVLVGIATKSVGVAAAVGVALFYCGAGWFHLRAGHGPRHLVTPGALVVAGIAAAALRASA